MTQTIHKLQDTCITNVKIIMYNTLKICIIYDITLLKKKIPFTFDNKKKIYHTENNIIQSFFQQSTSIKHILVCTKIRSYAFMIFDLLYK